MTTNNFKPILFSTEMVQAILAGRKMQTRRVVNPQPIKFRAKFPIPVSDAIKDNKALIKKGYALLGRSGPLSGYTYGKPKYQPGDILWVREKTTQNKISGTFLYGDEGDFNAAFSPFNYKKRPSIHMPKEAARIFLKVTNVRVERLQDISEEDAIAEGANGYLNREDLKRLKDLDWVIKRPFGNYQFGFLALWQSINAKKHPWESNPWVWVYEFERIEKPENFLA